MRRDRPCPHATPLSLLPRLVCLSQKAAGAPGRSDSLDMEMGATMAGEGVQPDNGLGAGPRGQGLGGSGGLPGPPPLQGSAALLAMVKAGIKLSSSQKKLLSGAERKEMKRLRKEAKKVREGGWSQGGGEGQVQGSC